LEVGGKLISLWNLLTIPQGHHVMQMKSSLFYGTAVGILLSFATVAVADAKPRHGRHAARAATDPAIVAKVNALSDEVEALKQRVDQDDQVRQQLQAEVQQAQADATQARAETKAAQDQLASQIQTIPGEVKTQVAAAQPKPGWWANTQVGGRVFYDLTNIKEKSDAGDKGFNFPAPTGHSANGTNFDIKRFYISIDHQFNSIFSANLTTDFNYDSGPAGATQLYIKKAYLQAKFSPWFTVRLGAADMPWVPFVENVYGYRYVENTLIDRTKFGTSAEWGAHILGSGPVGPTTVGYQISIVNGMGYKKPGFIGGVNRSEGMDFEGRVNIGYKGFVAGVGGYSGKLGQDFEGVTTYNTAYRADALLAYSSKLFEIGGEYMWASADVSSSQITLAPPARADESQGWGFFGNVNFAPQFSLFGRYDWVKPKHTTNPSLKNNYYNIGISYTPVKDVDFALVYKQDSIDNGAFADQNFSTTALNGKATYKEFGLWGQYKW
jgi:hypothetical protein